MNDRCGLAHRFRGVAAAILSLAAAGCTSPPDRSLEILTFEPGEAPRQAVTGKVGVESPLRQICALSGGRALLDRAIPGLTTRPEYPMFSSLSLVQLKRLSGGRITDEEIADVAAGLRHLTVDAPPTRIATRASGPRPARVTTTGPDAP